MLFLFTPGKLGLTSPVGRELGTFQLDPYGHVLLNPEHVAAISADPVLAAPLARQDPNKLEGIFSRNPA